MRQRLAVSALSLSAVALVSILIHEGYRDRAYIPLPGDKPTIGFGTTQGVRPGDTTTPTKALQRAVMDMQKFEGAVKRCVRVPLTQNEYDAYTSLAYNIGPGAFCSSTLVRKLNAGDFEGACSEILRWNKFRGRTIEGLTRRRQSEYALCRS